MIDTLSIRNSILRLGFSGKLTSQQNTDEKVSDMLSRINPKKDIVQTDKKIEKPWYNLRNNKIDAQQSQIGT